MGIEILSVTRLQATAIEPAIRANPIGHSQTVRVRASAPAFLRLVTNDPALPVEVTDEDYPLFVGVAEYFHVNAGEQLVVGAADATVEFVLVNAHGPLPAPSSVSSEGGGGSPGPINWDDISGKPPGIDDAPDNAALALLLAGSLGKVVVTTEIHELTPEQQEEVAAGVTVITEDDSRWVYKGAGSKLDSNSYFAMADTTPAWNAIEGRPAPLVERMLGGSMGLPVSKTINTNAIAIPFALIDDLVEGVFVIAPRESGGGDRLWRYVSGPSNEEASYLDFGPVDAIPADRIEFVRTYATWQDLADQIARPGDPFGGDLKAPMQFDIALMNEAYLGQDDPDRFVEVVTVEIAGPEFFGSLDDLIERGNTAAVALGLPSDTFAITGAARRDLTVRSGPLSAKLSVPLRPVPTELDGKLLPPVWNPNPSAGPYATVLDLGRVRTRDNGKTVSAQAVIENLQTDVRRLRQAVVAPPSPFVLYEMPGLSREEFTIVPGTEVEPGDFIVNGAYGLFGNVPEGTDLGGLFNFTQGIMFTAQHGDTVEQVFAAMATAYATDFHIDYDPATGSFMMMARFLSGFSMMGSLPETIGIAPDPGPVAALFVSTDPFGTFVWSKLGAFPVPPTVDVNAIFPAFRYGCVVEFDSGGFGSVVSRNAVLEYTNFMSKFPITGGRMFAGGVLERRNVVIDGLRYL